MPRRKGPCITGPGGDPIFPCQLDAPFLCNATSSYCSACTWSRVSCYLRTVTGIARAHLLRPWHVLMQDPQLFRELDEDLGNLQKAQPLTPQNEAALLTYYGFQPSPVFSLPPRHVAAFSTQHAHPRSLALCRSDLTALVGCVVCSSEKRNLQLLDLLKSLCMLGQSWNSIVVMSSIICSFSSIGLIFKFVSKDGAVHYLCWRCVQF